MYIQAFQSQEGSNNDTLPLLNTWLFVLYWAPPIPLLLLSVCLSFFIHHSIHVFPTLSTQLIFHDLFESIWWPHQSLRTSVPPSTSFCPLPVAYYWLTLSCSSSRRPLCVHSLVELVSSVMWPISLREGKRPHLLNILIFLFFIWDLSCLQWVNSLAYRCCDVVDWLPVRSTIGVGSQYNRWNSSTYVD